MLSPPPHPEAEVKFARGYVSGRNRLTQSPNMGQEVVAGGRVDEPQPA